ncbi:hypothetical protein CHS0354_034827, partial [Potamilus streckersoni]
TPSIHEKFHQTLWHPPTVFVRGIPYAVQKDPNPISISARIYARNGNLPPCPRLRK